MTADVSVAGRDVYRGRKMSSRQRLQCYLRLKPNYRYDGSKWQLLPSLYDP